MALGDDELKINLGFDINTTNAAQGFEQIRSLVSQSREDLKLMNDYMEGITDKADRMREYFQGNLEIISNMKTLLEAIQTINQSYQTTIGNNITLISELLNSVKGLNGDITHAMQMVNAASGGGAFGGVNIGNTSTQSQFSNTQLRHNERKVGPVEGPDFSNIISDQYDQDAKAIDPFSSPINTRTVVKNVDPVDPLATVTQQTINANNATNTPSSVVPPVTQAGGTGGRGRPPRGPRSTVTPPPGAPGPSGGSADVPPSMPNNSQVVGRQDIIPEDPIKTTYEQLQYTNWLDKNAPNIYGEGVGGRYIKRGKEYNAAQTAYDRMFYNMEQVGNVLPGNMGKTLIGHAKNFLAQYGMAQYGEPITSKNLGDVARSQSILTTERVSDGNGGYYDKKVWQRDGKSYTPVEEAAIKIANSVAGVMGSGAMQTFGKIGGYFGMAQTAYHAATDVMGTVRGYVQNSQAQAQNYGTVDMSRSVGNYLTAQYKAGFGLNPTINAQQVMQMQAQGAALGLRGANLTNFVNAAVSNQGRYGMSGAASQALENTALGAGISTSDIMNANAQVRQLEASTQTSTTYGSLALATGAQSAAAGGAGSAAAAAMGVTAAKFGAGDFIAQSYGMTGQEGAGTTLNNALMAQALGTSYTGLFAAERGAKGSTLARAQIKTDEQILGWAGIDTTQHYKDKNDFLNKNQNQIMTLSMILSDPQMGSKLNNIGSSPQASADWAWHVVNQHQQFAKVDAANKAEQQQGWFRHQWANISHGPLSEIDSAIHTGKVVATTIGHGVRNTVDAAGSVIGNVEHAGNYATAFVQVAGGALLQGHDFKLSQVDARSAAYSREYDTSAINRTLSPLTAQNTNWIATNTHNAWNSAYASATRAGSSILNSVPNALNSMMGMNQSPSQQVEINLHPDAKKLITAAVKNGTAGFNNGQVPPNRQPTRNN